MMQNPIAVTTNGYRGASLERALERIALAGFRSVELSAQPGRHARVPVESMSADSIAALKALLDRLGQKVVSISAHSDLASVEGVEYFKARIDFAQQMDVGIINTGATHSETPAAYEQFFERMKGVIPYADERNVRIAIETHGGLTGTAEDCLRTLERLGSDTVGINYDTANVIYYRDVRPEDDIKLIAPHVIHVHLKDKRGGALVDDFPPLGQGNIDFRAIIDVLSGVGYAGPYSAEVEFEVESPEEEDRLMAGTRQFMECLLAG